LFIAVFFLSFKFTNADTIDDLNKKIDEYQRQVDRLKSEANTLSNQISQYNAQISLKEVEIDQTEEKINQLGGRIEQIGSSLDSLTKAFTNRVEETYKMARVGDPLLMIMTAPNLSEAVSSFHYLQKIQESDQDLLKRLGEVKTDYEVEKDEQQDLQKELEVQRQSLNSQKVAKNNLLSVTKSDEQRYQNLLAEAKAQLSALKRFVNSQGGATILNNQTKCDDWGCYYNQRDALWGNIGLGGSNYSVAEYGCLVTSISMVASHYGRDLKPDNIAIHSNYFVPGTGYLYHTADGMPFSLTTASASVLDAELAAGRPVIAGLYGGPDHFIVILRKEGDNYIMHDPFMPDGHNKQLTDAYNVSDISSIRLVTFY